MQVSKPSSKRASRLASRPATSRAGFHARGPAGTLAAMIISVAPIKGGVGKSTVSVHLAAWLAEKGLSTMLLDCDPQESSSRWVEAACPTVRIENVTEADVLFECLPKLAAEVDVVVADGPGNNSEISRALLSWADLALLPCKAGQLELDSLAQTVRVLRQVQALRKGPPDAVVILNQVQERYLLTQTMREHLNGLGVAIAPNALAFRQIYADAPGQGKVVWQMEESEPRAARVASAELFGIFRTLIPDLEGPSKAKARKTKSKKALSTR